MPESGRTRIVVTDANVLINLIHVDWDQDGKGRRMQDAGERHLRRGR